MGRRVIGLFTLSKTFVWLKGHIGHGKAEADAKGTSWIPEDLLLYPAVGR